MSQYNEQFVEALCFNKHELRISDTELIENGFIAKIFGIYGYIIEGCKTDSQLRQDTVQELIQKMNTPIYGDYDTQINIVWYAFGRYMNIQHLTYILQDSNIDHIEMLMKSPIPCKLYYTLGNVDKFALVEKYPVNEIHVFYKLSPSIVKGG